jgi:hypothetical protein
MISESLLFSLISIVLTHIYRSQESVTAGTNTAVHNKIFLRLNNTRVSNITDQV